jgi:hypothetical protein
MALCYVIIIKSLYPHSPKGEGVYCFYTPTPRKGRGVYCFTSVCPSVQDIFRRIFLSNCWWQKSDIWSQASYRYAILWEAVLDPSDSYFLFADFVDFYTHWTYMFWEKCTEKWAYMFNVYKKINKVGKQEVGIWWGQKRFPQYGVRVWSLWPKIRFLPSTVTEKSATKDILDGRKDGQR